MTEETIKGSFEYSTLIDKCIDAIEKYPKLSSYKYIGNDVNAICNTIKINHGQEGLERFNRQLLMRLISYYFMKIDNWGLPEDVVILYKKDFSRIEKEIETEQYIGPYLYTNDKFCKDIAVCSMRLIPVGARKVQKSALPKNFLFRGGIKQFIKGVACIMLELKGVKPMLRTHVDSKDPYLLQEFNEKGLIKTYLRIAELVEMNKDIKGVFSNSWFNDPVLDLISPRLSYNRNIVVRNGGKIFHFGSNQHAVKDSTLKSLTRKKLYEEGKYLPTNYLLIWSRDRLLDWRERLSKTEWHEKEYL